MDEKILEKPFSLAEFAKDVLIISRDYPNYSPRFCHTLIQILVQTFERFGDDLTEKYGEKIPAELEKEIVELHADVTKAIELLQKKVEAELH